MSNDLILLSEAQRDTAGTKMSNDLILLSETQEGLKCQMT